MSTGYSEAAQAEAALALQRLRTTGTGEAPLDGFGMCVDILSTTSVNPSCLDSRAPAVSESLAVSTTRSVTASVAFDMVKDQVGHLAKSSKCLVQALNEVGKVHLFIQSVSCLVLTPSVITHPSYRSCCFGVRGGNYP